MRISFRHPSSGGLDSVHPLTKFYLTVSTIVLSFILDFTPQLILLSLMVLLSLLSQHRRIIFRRLFRYILPVIVLIMIMNILFYPESKETVKVLGMDLNEGGLIFGAKISLRLLILSLSLLFFFVTTPIPLLSTALLMKRTNPRILYIFIHSLQLIDTLQRKIKNIWIAQAARGLQVRGNPARRLRTFFPILLPLIFSYLSESLERGLALELKGLGIRGPKSFLIDLKESKAEHMANRLLLGGTGVLILWKVGRWLLL